MNFRHPEDDILLLLENCCLVVGDINTHVTNSHDPDTAKVTKLLDTNRPISIRPHTHGAIMKSMHGKSRLRLNRNGEEHIFS